jgi:hypothetical protein
MKALTVSGLTGLLTSPVYTTSTVCWGEVEYLSPLHQPLVDRSTFDEVQEILAARADQGTREPSSPLFEGVLACGY